MMMIMFKRELIRNRKSTLLWTAILLVYNVSMLAFYPSMMGSMKDKMDVLINSFPKEMMAAFGMDKVSITELLGFYNTYCYLMVTILGGIFAVLQGISILSKEEDEKTIEFLLSKPVTRNKIITSKILAVLVNIIALNGIVSVFSYLVIEMVKDGSYNKRVLLLLFAAPLLMQAVFAAMGFLISVFVVKARKNFPAGVGVVLGFYFIGIVAAISQKAEFLKYFTPFKYFDGADIVTNKSIDPLYVGIVAVISFLCVAAVYLVYNKKDIAA